MYTAHIRPSDASLTLPSARAAWPTGRKLLPGSTSYTCTWSYLLSIYMYTSRVPVRHGKAAEGEGCPCNAPATQSATTDKVRCGSRVARACRVSNLAFSQFLELLLCCSLSLLWGGPAPRTFTRLQLGCAQCGNGRATNLFQTPPSAVKNRQPTPHRRP